MPEFHSEPYLYLPAITHDAVLVAWGAFYFRVRKRGALKLVDVDDLEFVHPPRRDTIGARSRPYGPARAEVYDASGVLVSSANADGANHCWVRGLAPDTDYTYRVIVKSEAWASGLRWDWSAVDATLRQAGEQYDNRFRTFPDPSSPTESLTFAVIGDMGVGTRRAAPERQQQAVATALRRAVERHNVRLVLTTGDNIYSGRQSPAGPASAEGEDDDWFFTCFQPYRYILNRIPVYPVIGRGDPSESGDRDDRAEVEDNFYLRERARPGGDLAAASVRPGLFYRVRFGAGIEFVGLDTSGDLAADRRLFEVPEHRAFVEASLAPGADRPRWRIPVAHHPPFSAGPRHHNTTEMASLLPLFERAGVRAMFAGHEHNFQHSIAGPIDYLVTGAGGRSVFAEPDRLAEAGTSSWSSECHFLLVHIEGDSMTVRAIGGASAPHLALRDIDRFDASGAPVRGPIEIRRRDATGSTAAAAALPTPPRAPTAPRPRRPARPR